MKEFLIRRFKILALVFNVLKRKSTAISNCESIRRKEISLFDFGELAKPIISNSSYVVLENNLYGNGRILEFFKEFKESDVSIEHGFIFGSLVQRFTEKGWQSNIFTFSNYRKQFLEEKTSKNIVCIGPYIHYFSSLLGKENILSLKSSLGKVLLVFPSHSIVGTKLEFNRKEFISKIEELSCGYDTVLVCLYWADILKEEHLYYANVSKVKVVTAGHSFDTYFMNRLRSIFELGDFVLTNNIGTHIGYSIYLNKPLYIFNQEILVEVANVSEAKQRSQNDKDSLYSIKNDIYRMFNDESVSEISSEQYRFVGELFGFECVKK